MDGIIASRLYACILYSIHSFGIRFSESQSFSICSTFAVCVTAKWKLWSLASIFFDTKRTSCQIIIGLWIFYRFFAVFLLLRRIQFMLWPTHLSKSYNRLSNTFTYLLRLLGQLDNKFSNKHNLVSVYWFFCT